MSRLEVVKTGKLWIGGAWPRSESGRTFTVEDSSGAVHTRCALASRKDARDAVEAARAGWKKWSSATAMLRGQVLYRAAEMMESRDGEFADALVVDSGTTAASARKEVGASIDRLVTMAGWCDKFHQVLGCQNPVSGPYHNFTIPQSAGIVAVMAPSQPSLLGLVTLVSTAVVPGNAVVAVVPKQASLGAILLSEVLAVSDVPDGAINVLTGDVAELLEPLGSHREVRIVLGGGLTKGQRTTLRDVAAQGIRRVHCLNWKGDDWYEDDRVAAPWVFEPLLDYKTLWHPCAV
ncbi:MAG TPA: aldehyde dehydrogenase family protein [Phycisphaerales bacterium]|nr:aldehyde dehydrogenase family protein [Phycisphaerales bacterium]